MHLFSAITKSDITALTTKVIILLLGLFISNSGSAYAQALGGATQAALSSLASSGLSAAQTAAIQASIAQTASLEASALQQAGGGLAIPAIPALSPYEQQQLDLQNEEARLNRRKKDLKDPNSASSKALRLAKKSIAERKRLRAFDPKILKETTATATPAPPTITTLQDINKTLGGNGSSIIDDPINKKISVDLKRDAQKEAALSYGARGGLANRSHEIMERTRDFDKVLDRVFNFRALLITAPSGLLIEPPIVKESLKALVIKDNGNAAAVADSVFDINKNAKIVAAPRDWRSYIVQEWSKVPPPPRILWPKNNKEQRNWNIWISQGWQAGVKQADEMFELNVNKLSSDYSGMVRYRVLLAQGMISAPYTMHEERGVTGDEKQMRIGESALKITGPSEFIIGANLWKPADQ